MADPKPDGNMPHRVGVSTFRGNLDDFLSQAQNGRAFLITSHDEIVAELRPPPNVSRRPRQPGALQGKIRMAPDFDTLPPDVLAAMLGDNA